MQVGAIIHVAMKGFAQRAKINCQQRHEGISVLSQDSISPTSDTLVGIQRGVTDWGHDTTTQC
ncbi:hypothetical protein BGZ92_006109, partial [Podila epicladia]